MDAFVHDIVQQSVTLFTRACLRVGNLLLLFIHLLAYGAEIFVSWCIRVFLTIFQKLGAQSFTFLQKSKQELVAQKQTWEKRYTRVKQIRLPHLHFPAFSLPSFTFQAPHIPFPRPSISLPRMHVSLPRPRVHLQKKIAKPKLAKTSKPITIFPLPVSFLTKTKYFIAGFFLSAIVVFLPILFFIFLQDLPSPKNLTFGQIPQTTRIFDRQGKLLYQIYATENRTRDPLRDIPKTLQQATIAIEDKDFYSHPGFNIFAIGRSLLANIQGHRLQGGSTITQQLIKSALLTPETSITRKVKEVILAFWAERMYSKDQILELYFNQIPYGGTAWGAEAAAETYFNKPVKVLTLAESAFLAGIPQAPTIYSPFGTTPNLWKKRQKDVLSQMVSLKFITPSEAQKAASEQLRFRNQPTPLHAPHFVMYIKDVLVKKYGLAMVEKGGLQVTTSLDIATQDMAQRIVSQEVANNAYLNLSNGAALITNPQNGDILAMVGSHDFNDPQSGNVNLTTSLRQPGSSIKVVTYAAALASGFTASSILEDTPISFAIAGSTPYAPVNYDGRFHGRVPLRLALANSFNIPAVKMLNTIGIPKMVALAKNMGVSDWGDANAYGLSITLGAAEVTMVDMATVYGTLANGGNRVDLNPLLKVTDDKGAVLEQKQQISPIAVLDPGIAFILSDILADNNARAMEFGTNSPLGIPGRYVSVKTGTTDNKRDNWTIGYTPSYVVATWVGNNDNSPMSQALASGITGAAPIWHGIMATLLKDTPSERPKMPENVVARQCFGRTEYFIKGTETSSLCNTFPSGFPTWTPAPRQ